MTEKSAYHHGDLRNALVIAAAELAEQGGPDAVTIRAAAREVGVTPTATYRHFEDRDALMAATKDECLDRMTAHFLELLEEVPEELPPAERAVNRLMASGRAYLEFALGEPGLYRTCFCTALVVGDDQPQDTPPYALLTELLDEMLASGAMDPDSRPNAEALAWSAVHGLATLILDGPLARLTPEERDETIESTLRGVARGLGASVA